MQDKAVADLSNTYVPQFSDSISGATGHPNDAVTTLTKEHVLQTKQIVDDQAKHQRYPRPDQLAPERCHR